MKRNKTNQIKSNELGEGKEEGEEEGRGRENRTDGLGTAAEGGNMSSVSKAARQLVPAVTRRSSAVASQKFTTSAVTRGGATPPLAPFARIPVESEKLPEQYDAIWDDGVAPEVTLDFDCQHIDSGTGFLMWLGGLGFFATVYQGIKATDPSSKNPAVNRKMNQVGEWPIDESGQWKDLSKA